MSTESVQQFIARVSEITGASIDDIPTTTWPDATVCALILASRRESDKPGDEDWLVSVDWEDTDDGPRALPGSYRMIWQAQHDAPDPSWGPGDAEYDALPEAFPGVEGGVFMPGVRGLA